MGKLKALQPRLATLRPHRLQQAQGRKEYDQLRNQQEWRKWYKLARWHKLRWSVLLRDMFTCQMCKRLEAVTSKLVADHKRPHRGDPALFWDDANLQCLCSSCHSGQKQKDEARTW